MALPRISMTGNVVADPELRFTQSGAEVIKFRVACQDRYLDRQTNSWKDGDSCFLDVEVWREQANNIAESVSRGQRVTVIGSLRQRGYETKEGEKRSVFEVINAEVSASLQGQTAKITKVRNGQATDQATAPAASAPAAQAPAQQPAAQAPAAQAPAASAPAQEMAGVGAGSALGMLDEPPF